MQPQKPPLHSHLQIDRQCGVWRGEHVNSSGGPFSCRSSSRHLALSVNTEHVQELKGLLGVSSTRVWSGVQACRPLTHRGGLLTSSTSPSSGSHHIRHEKLIQTHMNSRLVYINVPVCRCSLPAPDQNRTTSLTRVRSRRGLAFLS